MLYFFSSLQKKQTKNKPSITTEKQKKATGKTGKKAGEMKVKAGSLPVSPRTFPNELNELEDDLTDVSDMSSPLHTPIAKQPTSELKSVTKGSTTNVSDAKRLQQSQSSLDSGYPQSKSMLISAM